MIDGFSNACDESVPLAQRAAAMTPKSSVFISCFVESKKWVAFRAGKTNNLYPFYVISVQVPQPGGAFTVEEFDKMRALAHKQLGDLISDPNSTKRLQAEEAERLKGIGSSIVKSGSQNKLQGFFMPPGAPKSFSFLTSRSATVAEAGVAQSVEEVSAFSTVFFEGRLLGISVVDQLTSQDQGLQVRRITGTWLLAFRESNGLSSEGH
jgi:hypothetical protein